jgi:hypothetical protein
MPSITKEIIAALPELNEEQLRALRVMVRSIVQNSDDDNLPVPNRPGRPRKNVRVSRENDDGEVAPRGRGRPRKADADNSGKRKPGRPRKDDAPAKRGPGRPRKDDSNNRPAARKAAAPAPRNSGVTDYSEMSQSELRQAAQKIGLDTHEAGIKNANLSKALIAIDKLANGAKSVQAWTKQAEKANVELVFGRGRPPATEEGLRRRIIVKMVNEQALRV